MRFVYNTLTVAAMTASLSLATAAKGAAPGKPTCQQLEAQCLKFVAVLRKMSPAVRGSDDATPNTDDFCYDSYSAARSDGVWPAHGPKQSIACANN